MRQDERRPQPPPLRDTGRMRIAAYTERVDPGLVDSSDRCLQHMAIKGDIARHEGVLRGFDFRLRQVEQKLAAAKPWVTLLAAIAAAVLTAVVGKVIG